MSDCPVSFAVLGKNRLTICTTETTVVRAQQQLDKNKVKNAKKYVKNSQKGENRIGIQIALYIDIRTKVHKISKQKERKRKNEEEGD